MKFSDDYTPKTSRFNVLASTALSLYMTYDTAVNSRYIAVLNTVLSIGYFVH